MLEPGTIYGGTYHLVKLLGKGGIGEVWLARHLLLNEPRAIKVILEGRCHLYLQQPLVGRQRFIEGEARNALRLPAHPGLVRVYEFFLGNYSQALLFYDKSLALAREVDYE